MLSYCERPSEASALKWKSLLTDPSDGSGDGCNRDFSLPLGTCICFQLGNFVIFTASLPPLPCAERDLIKCNRSAQLWFMHFANWFWLSWLLSPLPILFFFCVSIAHFCSSIANFCSSLPTSKSGICGKLFLKGVCLSKGEERAHRAQVFSLKEAVKDRKCTLTKM